MKKIRHKFFLIIALMLVSACAPKPQPELIAPLPEPLVQEAPATAPPPLVEEKPEEKAKGKVTPPPDLSQQEVTPADEKLGPEEEAALDLSAEDEEDKYIVLNFEDVDLQVVMQTISELIGMNYILGPQVKGKITIQTYKKIPREDLPDVLHAILAINGFTTVKSGHYYKIIATPTAKQHPIETRIGKDDDIKPEDVMVTQIIPLEHIAANELNRIIKPLVSKGGDIITHKDTNLIIINELGSNLKRLFKIINLLDVPTELASGEKIFVYYVENGDASKLASTLNAIYKKQKKDKKPVAKTAAAKVIQKAKRRVKKAPPKKEESLESELEGEMTIVADQEINALIIKTTARDYKLLLELLKKLDILPRQVLIEVLIANVTLDDSTVYGLEWASSAGAPTRHIAGHTGSSAGVSLPSSATTELGTGFTYLVERTNLLTAQLNLQAVKNNLEILSTPHVLTADNKEASINIVDQEPITKVTTTSTGTSTQSFEYKDAGIKLTVTPKINDKGLVSLKVNLEVSEVKSAGTAGNPSFTKRDVKTELVVQDSQTLVIGGLIKNKYTLDRTGVPWLMDIPYLGWLFGSTTETVTKNELVMLITPRVVGSLETARNLTKEFEKDVDRMRKQIKEKID